MVAGLEATEHAGIVADRARADMRASWPSSERAILCVGAFDRYRGMMLAPLGRHDEAVDALTAALALEDQPSSHHPLPPERDTGSLGALLQRDDRGDRARLAVELDRSIQTAERLGMPALPAAAGRALAEPEH